MIGGGKQVTSPRHRLLPVVANLDFQELGGTGCRGIRRDLQRIRLGFCFGWMTHLFTEMGGDFNVPVVMDVVTLLPGVPCRRANSPVCNVSPMVHGSVLLFRSQCL